MPLLKNRAIVADPWSHLDDAEAVPPGAPVTVSLARWTRERETLGHVARLGLRLPNDAEVRALALELDRFALIVLTFPRFTDGRAYSQARLLRRLGYKGELRAQGNVLRDQLLFMQRCGIDAFDIADAAAAAEWVKAFADFDVFYQPAQDQRPWAMRLRRFAKPASAERSRQPEFV